MVLNCWYTECNVRDLTPTMTKIVKVNNVFKLNEIKLANLTCALYQN